jgi:membrane-associated phospholipid phosphatase
MTLNKLKFLFSCNETDYLRVLLWAGLTTVLSFDVIILMQFNLLRKLSSLPINYVIGGFSLLISAYSINQKPLFHHFLGSRATKIIIGSFYYCETLCFAFLLVPATILAFYGVIISSASIHYIDYFLSQSDSILGFNWIEYATWANNNPLISLIYHQAYYSILWQGVICLTTLAIMRRFTQSYSFLLLAFISLITTILLVWIFPSEGVIPFQNINPKDFPNVDCSGGYIHLPNLHILRAGSLQPVLEGETIGLITFPSFHTVTSLLYMYTFQKIPYLRWPFLFLNILMLAATPLMGGHYITDCIAGVFVAGFSILLTNAIMHYRLKPNTISINLTPQ